MTRGAQPAANADIQAGNGSPRPRSTTTGRGRTGNWIDAKTWLPMSTWIGTGPRIRAGNWIREQSWIGTGTGTRARNWIGARTWLPMSTWIGTGTRTRARNWIGARTWLPMSTWIGTGTRFRTGPRVRAGAIAGAIGPAAFTAAWITAALRQPGLPFSAPQISGLAADNARDPWLMISAFLLLGGCAIGFGGALRTGLGGRQAGLGPRLIQFAGVLTIAAGLLRRDHVLLTAGPESWHNQAHDLISAAAYTLLIAAPLLLARRFRHDRRWSSLAAPLVASAATAAALLVVLYSAPDASWAATVQRIAVSLPLAATVAVAIRLTRLTGLGQLASPCSADAGSLPGRSSRSR